MSVVRFDMGPGDVEMIDGMEYRRIDGTLVGPFIDGHVFEHVDLDAVCWEPGCGRTALEHNPILKLLDLSVVGP